MFFANGDKYEGEWKDDLAGGKGVMVISMKANGKMEKCMVKA